MKTLEVVRETRLINAILKIVAKQNKCKGKLFAHPKFKYIMSEDPNDNTFFYDLEYNGRKYSNKYFSGCFNDYVCEVINK